MATVREVYTRALRKLRVLASGETPTAAEAADGLLLVQGILDGWVSGGLFGRLADSLSSGGSSDSFTADGVNYEVTAWASPAGDTSVELPARVIDPETGETVAPPDLALVEAVDEATGTRKVFLFEARRGGWQRVDNLTLDDVCPLSTRSVDGMAAYIAFRASEEFGATPGPILLREAGGFTRSIAARTGEARTTGQADYF